MTQELDLPTSGINRQVQDFIKSVDNWKGKKVLDCPAGDGRTSYILKKLGADVVSGDLFPAYFKLNDHKCIEINLNKPLPFEENHFDFIVSEEGIEHLQDQLSVLQEFSRVLKPGGQVLITTPSVSHLRAKLSHLLNESDYYKRSAPSEIDGVWFSGNRTDEFYFGHVFLINLQKLRTLALFSGLEIKTLFSSQWGSTSILLFPLFYPFILLANLIPFLSYSKKLKNISPEAKKRTMWQQFKMNCSPKVLLSKHTMVLFQKVRNKEQTLTYLRDSLRNPEVNSVFE